MWRVYLSTLFALQVEKQIYTSRFLSGYIRQGFCSDIYIKVFEFSKRMTYVSVHVVCPAGGKTDITGNHGLVDTLKNTTKNKTKMVVKTQRMSVL